MTARFLSVLQRFVSVIRNNLLFGISKIKEFKERLVRMGLPLNKDGEVYRKGIKGNSTLQAKFDSIDKKAYWKYRYQLWHLREPFDDLAEAISTVAKQIKSEFEKTV